MAREVQLRLLPAEAPARRNAEMAVRFLPARTIGGDLYDFVDYGAEPHRHRAGRRERKGRAGGPVCGAGQRHHALGRAAAARSRREMLATLNDALQERKLESQYVTMLFAVVERREPHAAGGQLGRRAAHLLPPWTVGDGARRGISAGDVSQRHL